MAIPAKHSHHHWEGELPKSDLCPLQFTKDAFKSLDNTYTAVGQDDSTYNIYSGDGNLKYIDSINLIYIQLDNRRYGFPEPPQVQTEPGVLYQIDYWSNEDQIVLTADNQQFKLSRVA